MSTAIDLLMSLAFKPTLEELAPAFKKAKGYEVCARSIPTVQLVSRIKGGEMTDAVIYNAAAIEELIAAGSVDPGSRVDIATCGVGVAVRPGARRPDLSSAEGLKRALVSADSIVYSTGPSGVYIAALVRRMGLAEEIAHKMRQVQGEPVGAVLARGEGEIGFQQVCELLPIEGIDYVGPLPREIQEITLFAGAVHVRAKAAAPARDLLAFLRRPDSAAVMREKGLDPV
jgi:molybdate transport system substrate-binding protein